MFEEHFSYRLQSSHLKTFDQKQKDSELPTILSQFSVHSSIYTIGSVLEPPNQMPHKASIGHTKAPPTSRELLLVERVSPATLGKLTISLCQAKVLTGSHICLATRYSAPPLNLIPVFPNGNKVPFLIYKNIPA